MNALKMSRQYSVVLLVATGLLVSGCGVQGVLTAAPGIASQVEDLKIGLVTAQVGGCASMLQQVNGQIRSLEVGTPVINVAPLQH